MDLNPRPHTHSGRARGFSLVELMVGMVIGLFLIGGAISVFLANQESQRVRMDLDNAQEAFRFGSHTITRVTQLGSSISDASTANQLVVEILGGEGVRDCWGQPVATGSRTNRFFLDGRNLVCDDPDNNILVRGVDSLEFTYGVDSNNDGWISNNEYRAANAISDWEDVTSIRARITMENTGIETHFVASLRQGIVAMHAGGSSPENPGPGNGGDGNTPSPPEDGNGDPEPPPGGGNGDPEPPPGGGNGDPEPPPGEDNGETGPPPGDDDNDDENGNGDGNGGQAPDDPAGDPAIGDACPEGDGKFAGDGLCLADVATAWKVWGEDQWGNGASDYCSDAGARVPTVDELLQLYDHRAALGGFNEWNPYWSSEQRNPAQGRHVQFRPNGPVQGHSRKGDTLQVRCVYDLN